MKRWIAIVLALALLAPGALADTYRRGDESGQVWWHQRALYALGYLNDEPDGKFGPKTERAVKDFQKAHCLADTGELDEFTMSEIEDALDGCTDPTWLIVLGFCQWNKRGGKLNFRSQVMNVAYQDTYEAVEMAYYCEDEYGIQVYPAEGTYQWLRTKMNLTGGTRKYTDYIALENASEIVNVYVAIRAVVIDGVRYETDGDAMRFIQYPIQ